MKQLAPALQAHLDDGTTTLGWCWRITRADGVAFGFTDHDWVLNFDGTDFEPESGFTASEVRAGSDLSVDAQDAEGVLSSDRVTESDIVVADASYSSVWVANFLTAREPGQRFITPRGLAGLGWGLPYAIGAKVARPDARVVGLVGDGGFAHVWSELETSRRMGLPVTLIVLNNQILGYQKHAEKVIWGDYTDVVDFAAVDHALIAQACGLNGIRVETPDDLRPALERALSSDITTVIDVITDERAFPPITMFEGNLALEY